MANNAIPTAPPPKSPLGRYRMLSPTAAVRVSPLCLGGMNFGNAWKGYMGTCDQSTAETILDYYFEQILKADSESSTLPSLVPAHKGNFIDTSNNYQFGESEKWIGEWMRRRDVRDQVVLATKYTTNFKAGPSTEDIMANSTGNGTKSLHVSVKSSLKNLQTDYIDILYVHWWDYSTSVAELMQSLNQLVVAGKVLYLGISDTPAWVVSKANEYARNHGLRQFSVYQGRWSAACRDVERDIIPMTRDEGMGICPWGTLGGGNFKTEEQRRAAARGDSQRIQTSQEQVKVSRVLESISDRKGTILTSVALAYVMHKTPYVFPIIGGRTIDHLRQNIEALTLDLSEDELREIEDAIPFDLGFPHNFLWGEKVPEHPGTVWLLGSAATIENVPLSKPIPPPKTE